MRELVSELVSELVGKPVVEASTEPVGKIEEDSLLAVLIGSQKKKGGKVFVELHLPEDVDEMLTEFKKDSALIDQKPRPLL